MKDRVHIRNAEAAQLARMLARQTGRTISDVVLGIIRGEPDIEPLLDLLDTDECAIGAPTLVEARLWCCINLQSRSSA